MKRLITLGWAIVLGLAAILAGCSSNSQLVRIGEVTRSLFYALQKKVWKWN